MSLPRSTYYDTPAEPIDDAEILRRVETICDEFEASGYRRVGAELRHQGIVVNAISENEKKAELARIDREHYWQTRDLELRAAQSELYLLTTLIGLKDPKAAQGISAVANAGIGIASSLQTYQKTIETLSTAQNAAKIQRLSSAVLTADIVGSVLTLAGALE